MLNVNVIKQRVVMLSVVVPLGHSENEEENENLNCLRNSKYIKTPAIKNNKRKMCGFRG